MRCKIGGGRACTMHCGLLTDMMQDWVCVHTQGTRWMGFHMPGQIVSSCVRHSSAKCFICRCQVQYWVFQRLCKGCICSMHLIYIAWVCTCEVHKWVLEHAICKCLRSQVWSVIYRACTCQRTTCNAISCNSGQVRLPHVFCIYNSTSKLLGMSCSL
jgi:hypothetical protein